MPTTFPVTIHVRTAVFERSPHTQKLTSEERDQAVAGRIAKSFGEIYNKNGSLKAGSDCREAEEKNEAARTKLDAAQLKFDSLQQAIHAVTAADRPGSSGKIERIE